MLASTLLYSGLVLTFAALLMLLRKRARRRGLALLVIGAACVAIAWTLPARKQRVQRVASHLDELVPAWQFDEKHEMRVAAPPERVFDAIREVRADEILLFRTLTWIRRAGRKGPESLLNPGGRKPLLEVATSSGFVSLADDPPREIVIGTVLIVPPGTRGKLTPEVFHRQLPPGFAIAAMNFLVRPDGDGSIVSTETRVYATDEVSGRRFAKYWRVIYPGSALIRRMWLRAIAKRAEISRSR